MATVVKFTLKEKNGCYAYYCNQSGEQSGEYIILSDYHHDLANVQQELIAAQEGIRRLREALHSMLYIFDRALPDGSIGRRICDEAREVMKDD